MTVTPKLLDCLKQHGARGAFFVIGQRVAAKGGKAIVQRAFDEGHRIANHTYTHPDLTKLTSLPSDLLVLGSRDTRRR